jgi:hypothetical protein
MHLARKLRLLAGQPAIWRMGLAALRTRAAREPNGKPSGALRCRGVEAPRPPQRPADLQAVIDAVCAETAHALHTPAAWVNL